MTAESKRPSHEVFHIEGEGKKAFWTKIGGAWSHDDGDGFTISLSCLPLNGRLVVRKPKKDDKQKDDAR
ncbi:hypothetical protein [Rhizobium leguminosarum]|uniref:hypothetical protein n=1 Tax=Rhizobium leguminosarum TaxID=384 RepID=UPI001C92B6EA|nr:hypothetical protein [Rhizobium leguminosarum]MBY2985672.1 hypothetical protein [Rhizobium leguminosarum]